MQIKIKEKLDGNKESYFLEYGQNVKQTNPRGQMENCLQIIYPSGDSQTVFFGENKTSDWFSMVRKPVIAFRDFDKLTKL